jgi:hypothetical protein
MRSGGKSVLVHCQQARRRPMRCPPLKLAPSQIGRLAERINSYRVPHSQASPDVR